MSVLFDSFIKQLKKNKTKVFLYSLESKLDGNDCINLIDQLSDFLSTSNKPIAISSDNNIFWPLVYLSAKSSGRSIYIVNPSMQGDIKEVIKNNYPIDLFFENVDLQKGFDKADVERIESKKDNNLGMNKDIVFTSGTTGFPKGAIVSEDAYLHVANSLIDILRQNETDLELLSMPFYHSFGLTRLRTMFLSGSSALVTDGLKQFPEIFRFSKTTSITGLSMVPSAIELIRSLLRKKTIEFSANIRYLEIGSSSLEMKSRLWLQENFNKAEIIHHYGMTECSRSFIRPRGKDDDFTEESAWIGNPLPGCHFKIKDDLFSGELLLKGTNLFSGYLQDEFNSDKLNDGWFSTGDICTLDNGKVFLTGRTDNQINIGGQKVQSENIEDIVESSEYFEKAICFPIEDPILGQKPITLISSKEVLTNETVNKEIDRLFKDYPNYYKPRGYLLIKQIPLTENGKKVRDPNILKGIYDG